MSRPFDVTAAAENTQLDKNGRAEIPFTVSNSSGHALRGQARAKALYSARQEWLTITGDVERDFSPNGTQQIVVQIAIPPGTAPGKCGLRLDVVSVDAPDEDYTEGPVIAFEVGKLEPDGKRVQPIQWGRVVLSAIMAAVLALAIIIVGATAIGNKAATSHPRGNSAGDIAGAVLGTFVALVLWSLLYFPLATLLSAIVVSLLVQYRRLVHTFLSVLVSIPIAIVLVWLLGTLIKVKR